MDLFLYVPKDVQEHIFCFTDKDRSEYKQLVQQVTAKTTLSDKITSIGRLSVMGLSKIPSDHIQWEYVSNPFKSYWRRMATQNMFRHGHRKVAIPKGTYRPDFRDDTAYIVKGYEASGAFGEVFTFVVYQHQTCVVKLMREDEKDWFELVTQAYLHEFCKIYRHIQVPKLLFLKRTSSRNGTYACMTRAKGKPIANCRGPILMKALALVMKALYQLQEDVHFMHRDLSGTNVWFDPITNDVTFIDFGMTCVNPSLKKLAWQSGDDSFYEIESNSNASMCTNRSLDASILISWMALDDMWCHRQHLQMKKDYKKAVTASQNTRAKQKLMPPKTDGQYTTIRKNWFPGNELKPFDTTNGRGDGPHWWLYNMVEFPVEAWFPENVLKRILPDLPLSDWFDIRSGWRKTFDTIMPQNLSVRMSDGTIGHLVKLVRKKCRILVEGKTIDVSPDQCQIVKE